MTRTQVIDFLVPVLFDLFDDEGPWQDADPMDWLEEMSLDLVQDSYNFLPNREMFFDLLKGELTSRGILRNWSVSDRAMIKAVDELMTWFESTNPYQADIDALELVSEEEFDRASEADVASYEDQGLGRYTIILSEEKTKQWRAQVKEAHECVAFGHSRAEAMRAVRETLELFFPDAQTAILDEELSR